MKIITVLGAAAFLFLTSPAYADPVDCMDNKQVEAEPILCKTPLLRLQHAEMERLRAKLLPLIPTIEEGVTLEADFKNYETARKACKDVACLEKTIAIYRNKVLYQRSFKNGGLIGKRLDVLRVISTEPAIGITGYIQIEGTEDGDVRFNAIGLRGRSRLPILGYVESDKMTACLFELSRQNELVVLDGTLVVFSNGMIGLDVTGSTVCRTVTEKWVEEHSKPYKHN